MTDKAQQYVDSLDIQYQAEFVPQSRSRNAGDRHPSLNWRVTVGDPPIETDYMQGIAHMPGYKHSERLALYHDRLKSDAAERGRRVYGTYPFRQGSRLAAPKLVDVLYSLVMDSDALNYSTFEEWADCFGYDTDSREAEKIYKQCLEIALQLRQIIDLDAAQEAFQDY